MSPIRLLPSSSPRRTGPSSLRTWLQRPLTISPKHRRHIWAIFHDLFHCFSTRRKPGPLTPVRSQREMTQSAHSQDESKRRAAESQNPSARISGGCAPGRHAIPANRDLALPLLIPRSRRPLYATRSKSRGDERRGLLERAASQTTRHGSGRSARDVTPVWGEGHDPASPDEAERLPDQQLSGDTRG
jgi:hypothetical protein